MRFVGLLLALQTKNLVRDKMARWMLVLPLVYLPLIRWSLLPLLDLSEPYLSLFVSVIMLSLLPLYGLVVGFLALDERDEGSAMALQVTPLRPTLLFCVRLCLPTLLSTALGLIVPPFLALPLLDFGSRLLIAFAFALLVPLYAYLLCRLAANKVQGVAVMKGISVAGLLASAAFFVPTPWQYLFGFLPSYWPLKLFWALCS